MSIKKVNAPKGSIIFVCHGNICRSPMAEYILKELLRKNSLKGYSVSSAAVSNEEIGHDIYPPAKRVLETHGIPYSPHAAHRITPEEFEEAKLILVMDDSNMRLLEGLFGRSGKARKLMEFAGRQTDVADPWYTRNFETTYSDIHSACLGLIEELGKDSPS